MYMAGRLRTASSPSRTLMSLAVYVSALMPLLAPPPGPGPARSRHAPTTMPSLAPPRHLRVEPPHLSVELLQRQPTTAQKLEAHARQLLVPGLERRVQGRRRQPSLEQMVSPFHHSSVSPMGREVRGKKLGGEAVQQAAPR